MSRWRLFWTALAMLSALALLLTGWWATAWARTPRWYVRNVRDTPTGEKLSLLREGAQDAWVNTFHHKEAVP